MPWLGEDRLPQMPAIEKITDDKIELKAFINEGVTFWSVFQLVDDGEQWRLLKKMPKSQMEWIIPETVVQGSSLRVQSVDGAGKLSEPVDIYI